LKVGWLRLASTRHTLLVVTDPRKETCEGFCVWQQGKQALLACDPRNESFTRVLASQAGYPPPPPLPGIYLPNHIRAYGATKYKRDIAKQNSEIIDLKKYPQKNIPYLQSPTTYIHELN